MSIAFDYRHLLAKGIRLSATMANVTDLQTKYSKLAQEYSKVKRLFVTLLPRSLFNCHDCNLARVVNDAVKSSNTNKIIAYSKITWVQIM